MKFSTIGTSWITQRFIDSAVKSGKASLHSVYSRREDSAQQMAEANHAKGFTDLNEMLKEPADFIYIASPNALHYEQILQCITREKHVFVEKPMVYTEAQLEEIRKQAAEKGVLVAEGFRHLFSPNYKQLKNALLKVGQVRSVLLQYVQYSSRYDAYKRGEEPNVFTPEFAGGAMMDLGVYPLSMAIDLFGEPEQADYFPVRLKNGVDGSGTLVLSYDGFHVIILCSKIAQATIPSEIHGEDGTLTMDHLAPIESLLFFDRKTKESEELAGHQAELDMMYEVEAFVRMVEENDTRVHEEWLERSRRVVRVTEAVRKQQGILFPGE
ncbi:Gfo/Idh/MocA family protein [Lentibacillus sediminis]|uniref:Gfo/Idh/MocA family protein n=1 Tax=Lentibacillus sediminis TaxID=1940529 RepID=UPI000C1BDDBA|nr:Gfo/Idh/MocA family oxidoreductase [Lentibacillus sediminis]